MEEYVTITTDGLVANHISPRNQETDAAMATQNQLGAGLATVLNYMVTRRFELVPGIAISSNNGTVIIMKRIR